MKKNGSSPGARRTLNSKWKKTKVLLKNPSIRGFIPDYRKLSRPGLRQMLNKHRMVYVKPVNGTQGQGVMRAELLRRQGSTKYRYQLGTKPRSFRSYSRFYASLKRHKLKRPYLVQQGIHLLTYSRRRFDIRVMVQRTRHSRWQVTGYIGRLGHPRKIVTNYHDQGRPMPLEQLLSPYLRGEQLHRYRASLERLSLKIARQLQTRFPGFREIGVDLGIDRRLRPWIIEVNTKPDPFIFRELKDKSMLRRALWFSRANGRFGRRKG